MMTGDSFATFFVTLFIFVNLGNKFLFCFVTHKMLYIKNMFFIIKYFGYINLI